jgi:hypothetical protein
MARRAQGLRQVLLGKDHLEQMIMGSSLKTYPFYAIQFFSPQLEK